MVDPNFHNGWNQIAAGLDVALQHRIPVRAACDKAGQQLQQLQQLIEPHIINRVNELTGLTVSMQNWINVAPDERESEQCIDMKKFDDILNRLALSSATIYVDRFHRSLDSNAAGRIAKLYSFDFNQAIEHCCIPYTAIDKMNHYEHYVEILLEETARVVSEHFSPIAENGQVYG